MSWATRRAMPSRLSAPLIAAPLSLALRCRRQLAAYLDDPLHEDSGSYHGFRIQLSDLYDLAHLGDRRCCGACHQRAEVPGCLAVDQVSKPIAVVRFDQRVVGVQRLFEHVVATLDSVSYTHLRAHETRHDLVCRLLLEKK